MTATKITTNTQTSNADADELFMSRCIQLALNAEGNTSPNPMVGAVIVYDGKIIGEGWHHKAGEPHAEVNAINSVREEDREKLSRSTIYVSLEPCAHQGRTPPCADLIVKTGIPRVVIGCLDTFSRVNGLGIKKLLDAGIEVKTGVLEEECRHLNRRFFTVQEKKRPYVILKWAASADGFIGVLNPDGKEPVYLTNEDCLRLVHQQRTTEDAILVGRNTVDADNPRLSARLWYGRQPKRYVIDPQMKLSKDKNVFDGSQETIIINNVIEAQTNKLHYVYLDPKEGNSAKNILAKVLDTGSQSVIIEGGAHTLQHFIDEGLWDEAFVFTSPLNLGEGVKAPCFTGWQDRWQKIGNCELHHYLNKTGQK